MTALGRECSWSSSIISICTMYFKLSCEESLSEIRLLKLLENIAPYLIHWTPHTNMRNPPDSFVPSTPFQSFPLASPSQHPLSSPIPCPKNNMLPPGREHTRAPSLTDLTSANIPCCIFRHYPRSQTKRPSDSSLLELIRTASIIVPALGRPLLNPSLGHSCAQELPR